MNREWLAFRLESLQEVLRSLQEDRGWRTVNLERLAFPLDRLQNVLE